MLSMLMAVQIAAALAGLVHVYIWVMESLRFSDPKVHRGVFRVGTADVERVRSWAFNQGWYNLFLAVGALAGVAVVRPEPEVGWTLMCFACGSMLGAALVLVAKDRTMASAALKQGLFPALALVFALVVALA
jgi:putative membrane protein